MKEFMMLFIGGDYGDKQLSPEQIQERLGKWNAWIADLMKEELYVEGRALQAPAKRKSGKAGTDDRLVTDGPFVETKELVGGYILFKARNMEHALALAEGYPDYDIEGTVEVREIMNFE